jgi:hypothetical protein
MKEITAMLAELWVPQLAGSYTTAGNILILLIVAGIAMLVGVAQGWRTT